MPAPEIDVLIHGAGPVGCTLALALRGTRLRVAVFDRTSLAASFRPIALSFAGRYAMVWSRRPQRALALAAAPDAEFLAELGAAAGHRPGRPVKVEARAVQPLVLRVRAARIALRAVFIGNAAQTLHPVAGQGLN